MTRPFLERSFPEICGSGNPEAHDYARPIRVYNIDRGEFDRLPPDCEPIYLPPPARAYVPGLRAHVVLCLLVGLVGAVGIALIRAAS